MTDENWYEKQVESCINHIEMALDRLEVIRENGMMDLNLSAIEDRLQTILEQLND